MKITKISILRANTTGDSDHLLATVAITFDDCFMVHSVRLIQTADRRFLVMPCKRKPGATQNVVIDENGKRKYNTMAICHPVTKEFATAIEEQVIAVFDTMAPEQRSLQWMPD